MRHEVIKLTDAAIYPELIKLLESKGEKICHETKTYSATRFAIGHDGNFWIGCEGFNGITITDVDFLQKYGENTEPEPAPAWSFKTDEELKNFVATFLATKGDFEQFLSSLRKPAFELICQDGGVTDPEQMVWYVKDSVDDLEPKWINCGFAHKLKGECRYPMFTTESAALNHRLHNTPAIKLSDMIYDASTGYYVIHKEGAHNLVNERINGK